MAQFNNTMNINNIEEEEEENAEFDKNSPVSDCESSVTGGSSSSSAAAAASAAEQPPHRRRIVRLFDESLAFPINPNDNHYKHIEHCFINTLTTSLSSSTATATTTATVISTGRGSGVIEEKLDVTINVVAIHRRNWTNDVIAKARVHSFQSHLKAFEIKLNNNNGETNPNPTNLSASPLIHFAYFGGSKSKIEQVLSRGFNFSDLQSNPNSAIFLSPDHSPAFSFDECEEDEYGVRHMLLCRVLLGRSEVIGPDSAQTEPSSNEYDSGIDDLYHPKKYIIWSTNMNAHILPEYVISFTFRSPHPRPLPPSEVYARRNVARKIPIPSSPWVTFPELISVLSRRLPADAVALITKHHDQYKEKRISRPQLIDIVRQIAGDKLLTAVIKSCRARGARDMRNRIAFMRDYINKRNA